MDSGARVGHGSNCGNTSDTFAWDPCVVKELGFSVPDKAKAGAMVDWLHSTRQALKASMKMMASTKVTGTVFTFEVELGMSPGFANLLSLLREELVTHLHLVNSEESYLCATAFINWSPVSFEAICSDSRVQLKDLQMRDVVSFHQLARFLQRSLRPPTHSSPPTTMPLDDFQEWDGGIAEEEQLAASLLREAVGLQRCSIRRQDEASQELARLSENGSHGLHVALAHAAIASQVEVEKTMHCSPSSTSFPLMASLIMAARTDEAASLLEKSAFGSVVKRQLPPGQAGSLAKLVTEVLSELQSQTSCTH